ncbi:hypothetical protein WME98_10305 [Sorangium sp. So ce296]|uniref:hypothetical protein n=1 Tax=Sorangium sp. So ce296 TaxID=3133296 RepID=UPI003F6164C5
MSREKHGCCLCEGAHRRAGKRVAAYGAPAKGNTLPNHLGIVPETLESIVDGGKFIVPVPTPTVIG